METNVSTSLNTVGMGSVTLETDPCVIKKQKNKKKHISDYIKRSKKINEGLSNKQKNLLGNFFINIFSNSKLTQDKIQNMLMFLEDDKETLIAICGFLNEFDKERAFVYLPEKDDLLKKENYEKIIKNLSEYIVKYLCE